MEIKEFSIPIAEGELYAFHTRPEVVRGVVVLVHGFGEHSGRYREQLIPELLAAELAVISYDNVGHGRSSGKRGHCSGYAALLAILDAVLKKAEQLYPRIPRFFYGHSMGGNLVLNYALRKEVDLAGIVATSPYLRLAFSPPKWKLFLGRLLMGLPITLPSGLDPNGISRLAEEVEKYRNDPLVHDKVSAMYSFPVIDAGAWAIENAKDLNIATLLLHGTADSIIDPKGSEEFHENCGATKLQLFEGGYHELHNDLCRAEVLATVITWLKQRLV